MSHRNLVALHRWQAERLGPLPALRYKRNGLYHDLCWADYREQAVAAAAALVEAGVAPGDRVGLVAENRVEWLVADMAIMTAGAVNVPPHAPLTAAQIHFQLADAGTRLLIVSTSAQADKVRQVASQLPPLQGIVAFDRAAAGSDMTTWEAFLHRGRRALARNDSVRRELERREAGMDRDTLATIMYTSGTTGNPKGVMLTHGNLLSNAGAMLQIAPHRPDDVVLNWLPFSHIYARTVDHYKNLLGGVLTCLAESAETVVQNLEDVQPTHLASVPRFYEKVYAAASGSDAGALPSLPEGEGRVRQTTRNLRRIFGPRIDWMSSGGATLPLAIAEAYQRAGLLLLQGYGLTESAPVISFNHKEKYKLASVGLPLPGVEVRLAADGEVLTRGPHVMLGYWNNPDATAEAIRDGWLHTGDLGRLDDDGFLYITGRKKELLVMSTGKKVVPSYLEGLLLGDPCIDQAVICGEGRSFLTALLVPNWDNVRHTLAGGGVTLADDPGERCRQPEVAALLQQRACQQLADVSRAEQVRKFVVLPQPFSVADEEMTVSFKLRRNVVLHKYARQLEALYQECRDRDY